MSYKWAITCWRVKYRSGHNQSLKLKKDRCFILTSDIPKPKRVSILSVVQNCFGTPIQIFVVLIKSLTFLSTSENNSIKLTEVLSECWHNTPQLVRSITKNIVANRKMISRPENCVRSGNDHDVEKQLWNQNVYQRNKKKVLSSRLPVPLFRPRVNVLKGVLYSQI